MSLIKLKIVRAYPHLKPHILFYDNDLAIWHALKDIKHIKPNIMADGRSFEFDRVELFLCISLAETTSGTFFKTSGI